jgi:hypothetical protein
VIGWVAAVGVVLGGAQALAINKVDAGLPWQIAAAVLTLLGAGLAGWITSRAQQQHPAAGPSSSGHIRAAGSVDVSGRVGRSIKTRVNVTGPEDQTSTAGPPAQQTPGTDVLGEGAVRVRQTGDVGEDITTDVRRDSGTASTP